MSEATREEVLDDLEPLIREAERAGKWLHCQYQNLWFSPKELRIQNSEGHFIWGAVNWTLRDPMEEYSRLCQEIHDSQRRAIRERDAFAKRMA